MIIYRKTVFLPLLIFNKRDKFMKTKVVVIFLAVAIFGSPFTGRAEAEDFIWGTEGQGTLISSYANIPEANQNVITIIKNELKIEYVKIRIRLPLPLDGEFTPDLCGKRGVIYSGSDPACSQPGANPFNLDETVKIFKENGWSMFPMFSHAGGPRQDVAIDDAHIERYVDFVDWFVGRYKQEGEIKYIELVNAPSFTWKATAQQLLDLNNKTYDRIKSKFPDIQVGTPGFEYFNDSSKTNGRRQHENFRDYFLENDAKFDFWAFHGYPTRGEGGLKDLYPPTKIAKQNKYSGIYGIAELRKKLNARGWSDRGIIDTEHTGVLGMGILNAADDQLNAAYMLQELILKRTLQVDGKSVLSGIITMKILPRCEGIKPGEAPGQGPPGGKQPRMGPAGGGRPRMGQPGGGAGMGPGARKRPGMGPPGQGQRPPGGPGQQGGGMLAAGPKSQVGGGECAWGDLYEDGSESLAVKSVGLLISKLAGYQYETQVGGKFDDENQLWVQKFKKGDNELYICFKPFRYKEGQRFTLDVTKSPVTLEFKAQPSSVVLVDINGNRNELKPAKSIKYDVGNTPEFIEVKY